jgi:RNA polymerase sigma-70 factor (ECF subfamily)
VCRWLFTRACCPRPLAEIDGPTGRLNNGIVAAMTPPEEIRAWMQAVATKRDRGAFARLLRYFAPRVKSYLLRGGASAAQVDEVVQESMLTVWSRAERYDPDKASVSTWIFTIARNRWIDRVRKIRRPACDPNDPAWVQSAPAAPDSAVAAKRSQSRVQEAMASLPDDQATIIRCAYFEGKSQRDIAEDLGVPIGTVKSRVRLALKRLRDVLDPDPDPGPSSDEGTVT